MSMKKGRGLVWVRLRLDVLTVWLVFRLKLTLVLLKYLTVKHSALLHKHVDSSNVNLVVKGQFGDVLDQFTPNEEGKGFEFWKKCDRRWCQFPVIHPCSRKRTSRVYGERCSCWLPNGRRESEALRWFIPRCRLIWNFAFRNSCISCIKKLLRLHNQLSLEPMIYAIWILERKP